MPITELPQATVRLLGSQQIISTPVSLVKELLDNAIDAKATNIEILLSHNTTDRIEVRDNGVGIHPEDHNSLGKHGHTSKLGTFEDLRTLAGSTLGFRGEALASANALGKLTITTKTSSESVAALLHIDSKVGGVGKEEHTSAPVGTTVCVTDLYHRLPVRKTIMDKSGPKFLGEVQSLLQSYAMARPQLRLSMKVLKSSKRNWTYSPKPGDGVEEAMIQLFGNGAKFRCTEMVRSFGITGTESRDPQPAVGPSKPGFVFEAYWAAPTAPGLDRVPRQCFFSVDGRPITASRGIAKKLKSTYHKYVARMLGISSEAQAPENIFIRLNIKCPKGSYDVNIEPLKDSVLFEDEGTVLASFEEFCRSTYGPHNDGSEEATTPAGPEEANPSLSHISCFVNPVPSTLAPTASCTGHTQHVNRKGSPKAAFSESEYGKMNAGLATQQAPEVTPRTELSQMKPPAPAPILAPTTNATAFQSHTNTGGIEEPHTHGRHIDKPQHSTITSDMSVDISDPASGNTGRRKPAKPSQSAAFLVGTPQHSTHSPRQPLNPRTGSQINAYLDLGRIPTNQIQYSSQDNENRSSNTPEPPILRHPGAPPGDLDLPSSSRNPLRVYNDDLLSKIPVGSYQSPVSSPVRPNPTQSQRPLGGQIQLPWTPPSSTRKQQGEWESRYSTRSKRALDGLKQTTISFNNRRSNAHNDNPKGQVMSSTGHQNSAGRKNPHLSQVFDTTFSTARQQLMADNNLPPKLETVLAKSVANPTEEYTSEPLQEKEPFTCIRSSNAQGGKRIEPDTRPTETSIPSGDSRAYLLRRQKSVEANKTRGRPTKLRRLKSSLMPLETIPKDDQTHGIVLEAQMDIRKLEESLESIQKYDLYVVDGGNEEALDLGHNEASRVQERLDALLSCWLEQQTGEKAKVESHLCELLKGSGTKVQV